MICTNTVVLLGTIAREPQAVFLQSGAQEVSSQIKLVEHRDGNEYATYCPISAYGRAGDTLLQAAQGATIALTGKVAWKKAAKEGEKGGLFVMVRTLEVEERRQQEGASSPEMVRTPQPHDDAPAHGDEDLPF